MLGKFFVCVLLGWLLSVLLGIGFGFFFVLGEGMVVIGIVFSFIVLGILMLILCDVWELDMFFGWVISMIGVVGEFLFLIVILIFFSMWIILIVMVVLLIFVVLVGFVILFVYCVLYGWLYWIV